ncbi:glycerol-3-phosphate ABC transporter ATP-binding protein [Pandoraea thiooxydans]|uniref:Glycerol-3-phosphate ABC transporter ATP-binding protein n=1 Tax=Pandoraea thiooxydans TaxID=445709 RepID=A0A0G3EQS0_9BURK|nr:sn-glycerol-3-phosphate import ATP-binding protein UgpC [Pandoraea thiooxydans]AKJ67036.1 sn-glycerol-3-phosphate ABC transporter ATP-binding protein UgpC [Pandoraea thiooxydans]APR93960.1 glycerol-3-phosphate ABC transporter ATP-binding protein [Pandoraea thiooxydans]
MAKLTLSDVKKSYDGKHFVLHGIDIAIDDGEFVVIVGPSGCGKSTLLRMVAGLESVTAGDIHIGEKRVNTLEPKDRDIAMVFQNYALYPHMDVFANMAYGLKIRRMDQATIRQRVESAARILELEPLLGRKPRELSGGQRQRVAMGRAIVREPAVFLFDEPLSNLDAKLRVQMRLEIKRLHARLATTSLYVTHDQVEAMTLASRVIVMNQGHAEQIGTPVEVYERPATLFVASFIGSPAMNLLRGRIDDQGKCFAVAGGGPALPLPQSMPALAGHELVLGVRPEHLLPARTTQAGQSGVAPIELPVDTCELLGADNLAHGRWGDQDVIVRLPHELRPGAGEVLPLALPAGNLHIFDADSGKRIEA